MAVATAKEFQEWCGDCFLVCDSVEEMIRSGIYRTETSRWWAITKELSTLEQKLRVIQMKVELNKSWKEQITHSLRFCEYASKSAFEGYGFMYHKTVADFFQKAQSRKVECDTHLAEVREHLNLVVSRCR